MRQWARKAALGIVRTGLIVASFGQTTLKADVQFSAAFDIRSPADFYSPLTPYGAWVDVSPYGRCWHPSSETAGWRPYTVGYWEWTDAGWYWTSDEPWAWACYHYGSWVLDPVYGWVWLPGVEWAPAWVVWREAPDYIGWAPCGPRGVAVSDSYFAFVDIHHFHDHLRPRELVFNDPRIINRSRPVGRFQSETRDFDGVRRRIAFNQGPSLDPIQRATGTKFKQRPVRELVRQNAVPNSARRNVVQPGTERTPMSREAAQPGNGRQQPRLYREAPQPTPTGREQPRIYREAPTPQPAPRPKPESEVPRRQPTPEMPAPTPPPNERPVPPAIEHGRSDGPERQAPRREELPARVTPAQRQPPAAPTPSPGREKEKDREGQ
jgi:hypothetical protein